MYSSQASTSHCFKNTAENNSIYSDVSKQRLKDALVYFEKLLVQNNLIATTSSDKLSEDAILLGTELFNNTLDILNEKQFITDDELIHDQEECPEGKFEAVKDDSSDNYVPDEKKYKMKEYISLEYKIKVLNLAKAHLSWKLETLQKKGCSQLKRMDHLKLWEKDVEHGGTIFDKYFMIDSWTYDRFVEMRQNYKQVTTRNLQQWALAAASQFVDFQFKASKEWADKFKRRHRICQRKVTKFVSQKEACSMEEILAAAETFRIQAKRLISNFDSDFIINTDQTATNMSNDPNEDKKKLNSGRYKTDSVDLLSQWLHALETRSSLFWLRYLGSGFNEDQEIRDEKRANSLGSTDSSFSDIDADNIDESEEDLRSDVFANPTCRSIAHRESDLLVALSENCTLGPVCYFCSKKNSIVLRTQLSVRVHTIIEKLLTSEGRELRRALFSLKQIFQEDKDLVHEFVQNDGLSCLIKVGSEADQNYQNYILRALGQVMLYVDGMNGVMEHNQTIQWLYSLISSKFRLVVKTALKLLLVFVEYTESNCMLLIKAIHTVDYSQGVLPYYNIMKLLKDFDSADTELLIYAMTLINKILGGVPDQDSYYDQSDALEEQGIESVIQRYMSKPGTDLDLLQQFQIYEAVLHYEDGDEGGTPMRHLDENIRNTIRNRKSVCESGDRRKSRRHSTGNTPVRSNMLCHSINNNLILQPNNEDEDDESSSSQSSGINNSQLNGGYKDNNKAFEAGVTPALRRRRERTERQRSFLKEQESAGFFRNCLLHDAKNENENGNYPFNQRLSNGNGVIRNSSRKDMTPIMNAVNKLDSEEKQPWVYSIIQNQENIDDQKLANENERNVLLQLQRENTVKDITQKLANQNIMHSPSEESKVNRIGDMSGLISKAKEGLAKSKSKADVLKSPTNENVPKMEIKKSENELRWEELIANLNRSLNLCDMDFTDLGSEDEVDILAPVAVANGIPPPPPPLSDMGCNAPPPPPLSNRIIPPPAAPAPPSFLQRPSRLAETKTPIKKNKKTVKLFWKEVRDDPISHLKLKTGFIWDELNPVNVDTQKLEHLFESRAKDLITKKQQEMNKNKEIIVLDPKRSNAINIGMTKLPPPRSIKTAILKMDATIMNREGIEKLLTMLPTEEERTKIQEAQASNPDIPLGSAEQFLLTLASISELPARLKLWAFKLDFENSEREIAEPLMDLKQGFEVLRVNKTFRGILSTLLSIGNFLNGNEVKGFQIEYLAKVPEVKDTVHKHSLLHHLCHIVMEKFPDASDLYSEIGAITRASKIDFDELALNIQRLESDCKASWDHLKLIAKHDGSTMMKVKMSDFLSDCAERIILLGIVHRRIINRFHKFLLWLGIPLHQIADTKPNEFCRVISEFALEYRTTRERVLQQLEKKANHRERNKTRGKMITEVGKFRTKEDRADAELRQLLGSDMSDMESLQGTLPWRRTRRESTRSFLGSGNGNLTDGDDELLESLVKNATKGPSTRTAPRERKRTRHADRKSLRRTLKNGLSEEEKKHLSAYIKGY